MGLWVDAGGGSTGNVQPTALLSASLENTLKALNEEPRGKAHQKGMLWLAWICPELLMLRLWSREGNELAEASCVPCTGTLHLTTWERDGEIREPSWGGAL